MVASISAFSRMTSLPCLKASNATRAPNSTEPVTSTRTSTPADLASRKASSVTTTLPSRMARSTSSCFREAATFLTPQYSQRSAAR